MKCFLFFQDTICDDTSGQAEIIQKPVHAEEDKDKPIQESGFRAIMFVDMVSSTDITKALGDSAARLS